MTINTMSPALPARVGRPAPAFDLPCTRRRLKDPDRVRLADFAGRWLLLIFYPRDFSFVCPTELTAFSARISDFEDRECELLGVSVDDLETHERWLATPAAEGGLFGLRFRLASDTSREVACAYGVDFCDERVAGRGLFLIDPEGTLQYAVVHNLSVGRSSEETLRVLDALRQGGLCPASWTRADGVIDPSIDLAAGRVWEHYRIEKKVGTGGFGNVFAAWDLLLERRVALKVGHHLGRETRSAALAEARAAARVVHPNVCALHAVDEKDGVPLIVMEYLAGAPLNERLKGGLTSEVALQIGRDVIAGVAASHAAGVIHGDLKPANILFSEDGTAKVADFGVARQLATDSESATPPTSAALSRADSTDDQAEDDSGQYVRGTPAYMAPEQTEGSPPTAASDVFAIGLLLFELLTGERAVKAKSPLEALEAVRVLDAVLLAERLPAACRGDLIRILALDPDRRPAMAEVEEIVGKW